MVLGARDTNDLISMVSFTFTMRRHLIRLASGPLPDLVWQSLVVPFAVCDAWQRSRTENLQKVSEISGPIFTRLWTEVHEIFRRCL